MTTSQARLKATLQKQTRRNRARPKSKSAPPVSVKDLEKLKFLPSHYIEKHLGWKPWEGGGESTPGQIEILDAYALALRQQIERRDFEQERVTTEQLTVWRPGTVIKNVIRVEAGHGVGKTKVSSGIVNHFFDCFRPSIIYTFAPTKKQIHDLLWKEIKSDRRGKGLPGRILDLALHVDDNHFANGMATSDADGKGTERAQGQHGEYLLFVLDEAEGIADFVFDAIDSMAGGGICIILMLANPRTRASRFHRAKDRSTCVSFRLSCLNSPNVRLGREVIPGSTRREYVETMVEKHCEVLPDADEDTHSFTLDFAVSIRGVTHPAGTHFKPNSEFLFRVLGVAPKNLSDKTLIPVGRFEAACARDPDSVDDADLTISVGVDVARYGHDFGTIYFRWRGVVWRVAQCYHADTPAYVGPIIAAIKAIRDESPEEFQPVRVSIRVDGGGGFGSGVIDTLKNHSDLREWFGKRGTETLEVHFGGTAEDSDAYRDLATQMYAEAAEVLLGIAIVRAPETLEGDLCERQYKWVTLDKKSVKKLEPKDEFRAAKRKGRSPDDGDGFVLCVAPGHIFERLREFSWF